MPGSDVPAWRLRPISKADFEWAFALHEAALGEYVEQTWGWDEEVQRRMFSEAFDRQPRQVIEVDGHDIGVLVVEERPDEVYLGLIELVPSWQNRGLGTAILRRLLRRAEATRRPLSLHVLKSNPRALALYEREGLRVVDSEPTKLLMRSA
jgi:ribosomal protein S18 acetylase RimI-like enzyme